MDFWIKAAQLITSLSILIVLHEFGHFIPARLFKTKVEKFYLFFNWKFSLFKKKIGETEWGIGWIPLGGYVKIAGMIDESMDKEQMSKPAEPWEFRSKPAWQRLIIMIGGVVVNLIVGFLFYMLVLNFWGQDYISKNDLKNGFEAQSLAQKAGFVHGDRITKVDGKPIFNQLDINRFFMLRGVEKVEVERADGTIKTIDIPEDFGQQMFQNDEMLPLVPRVHFIIDDLADSSKAKLAGLQNGDSVIAVNGRSFDFFDEYRTYMSDSVGKKIEMTVVRNGKTIDFSIEKDKNGKIGAGPNFGENSAYTRSHKDYSFGAAFSEGFAFGYWTLHDYVAQFQYLFTKKGAKQVGGFVAIGKMFPATWDWRAFWMTTALLSFILAFMNILPIPALDGGHVVFLLYEIITGREAPQKVLEIAQYIGVFLLLGLLLYANLNDIYKLIFGG